MSTAYISHLDSLKHDMGQHHPESPDRVKAIEDQLILSRIEPFLTYIDAPLATEEQLQLVHTQDHIQKIQVFVKENEHHVIDDDTKMNPHSYQAALRSVGGSIMAVDAVMSGQVKNAFACTRPPGHHAEPNKAMGFCFLITLPLLLNMHLKNMLFNG